MGPAHWIHGDVPMIQTQGTKRVDPKTTGQIHVLHNEFLCKYSIS